MIETNDLPATSAMIFMSERILSPPLCSDRTASKHEWNQALCFFGILIVFRIARPYQSFLAEYACESAEEEKHAQKGIGD